MHTYTYMYIWYIYFYVTRHWICVSKLSSMDQQIAEAISNCLLGGGPGQGHISFSEFEQNNEKNHCKVLNHHFEYMYICLNIWLNDIIDVYTCSYIYIYMYIYMIIYLFIYTYDIHICIYIYIYIYVYQLEQHKAVAEVSK